MHTFVFDIQFFINKLIIWSADFEWIHTKSKLVQGCSLHFSLLVKSHCDFQMSLKERLIKKERKDGDPGGA